MKTSPRQPGLFDTEPTSGHAEAAALARGRMRAMIEGLRAAAEPPWTDEMGVILRDGEFKRAMYLVPADEAAALWAEFDAQMERLYAIWAAQPDAAQG
jgi:hypothetical protein